MIRIISNSVSVENIEEIAVLGNYEDGNTNLHIIYSDLTPAQKTVYTNGLSVVSGKYFVEVSNTEIELSIDRMTSEVLEEGTDIFDFETMSDIDKDKLRALSMLFSELSN
jgi:methionine synthase I (cobalamin-dependent)